MKVLIPPEIKSLIPQSGKELHSQFETSESGMELRDLLLDKEFPCRVKRERGEKHDLNALVRLAHVFAETPDRLLHELVSIAVDTCGADSAGISLEEQGVDGEPRFRWVAVAGSFAPYKNGTTPRFFSPCGTCLDEGRAQLYRVTKQYYDYLGIEAEPITDGMLIPWVNETMRGTIWAVAHHSREAFDFEDYKLLSILADFTSIALRYQHQQDKFRRWERDAAAATTANDLAHQINNPLQGLTNSLYLARLGVGDSEAYLKMAWMELSSLSELVRKILSPED